MAQISQIPYKLVLPDKSKPSAFYTVIPTEMDPKVRKMVNLAQIWTCKPLMRPIIHQLVMLECLESPEYRHKLVQPDNVSISAFYTVILGIMDPKVAKLVNLAQIWTCRSLIRPIIYP